MHLIKSNSLNNSQELIKEEKNEIIPEDNNNEKKFYLISVYESHLDINFCEYDPIIKQYIQTSTFHQNFFCIIFDSEIIDSKIILLTSIGLFIYEYDIDKNKLNLLYNEIFNIKCEPKDLLMYLKINQELKIIVIYSNTNLFFIYYYDDKNKKIIKVNQINKLCNGYINYINIFNIKEASNYFIISIQNKIANEFFADNYIYYINKEKLEINEIIQKEIKEEIIINNIEYINNIYKTIKEKYHEDKINEIRYCLYGKYIFIINQNGFIILKNRLREKGNNIIELMIKYKFKYGQNIKSSFFIDYQNIKNFHFLFFDNKISIFEENNDLLFRIKLTPKLSKKFLTNSNAIFQDINNEISLILYNYKNDITFITLNKEKEKEENKEKYNINIITRITNESMFCLDGVISSNNKEEYKIIAICGLQGNSRLIKYSNIFTEIVLHNQQIDSQINSIYFPCHNFKSNYFSNIFITSNGFKSNLYTLSNTFQINQLKEFASPALKIYPLSNNLKNSYIIILKYGVGIISFNDINNLNQYSLNNLYECKNNKENNDIANDNDKEHVLFSYYFLFKNQDFLVIYLNNTHMICFNINTSSVVFDIELNNLPQPSALGVISIESLNELGFIFGNYLNNHIIIIYYNMENKAFNNEKISETKLSDSSGLSLLTPDDILIYKYYIFITTHTGDFIVLHFNEQNFEKSINIIYNLENITKNKINLKFSQIDFSEEKNEFNIDLFNFKNAYNIILNINNSNNEINCNLKNQLTKYKFNNDSNISLVNFQKIFIDKKGIKLHFYLTKNFLNFSYFQEQTNKNDLSIETIYNFPSDEKALKIISITERNGEILILTNNLKLYLFNEKFNLILIKNINEDVKKTELKIVGVKNYLIIEDDEGEKTDINIIILFGGFKDEKNNRIGILIVYQYIDTKLIPIKIITGYPQPIIDACFIKRYIICGIEAALCVRGYFVKNKGIEWNQDISDKLISNYMNKITNLIPLNNLCNNYYLITCDEYESFQLIKFNSTNPDKYETLGADLSLNEIGNIYPINNSKEDIIVTNKKGVLTKYELKEEIYRINNRVDLKEYISKIYINNNKIIMIGLLGSIYFGEIYDKNEINNKKYENELLEFQKNVFKEVSNINLNKIIEYEEAMLMNEKINNVLLVDTLDNFCDNYYDKLNIKINDFQNMVKYVKYIKDNLVFKNE